jgi:hypothetical protein
VAGERTSARSRECDLALQELEVDVTAAAAGVRLGPIGGAKPTPGRPQLNSPSGPLRLTEPAGQE